MEPEMETGEPRPLIEWIIGALSGILVLLVLGFLFVQGVLREPGGARLTVSVSSIEKDASGLTARIDVTNHGDAAASAVTVEGSLAGAPDSSASIEFDYIAGKGKRHGTLHFPDADPSGLKVRITGHVVP